MTAQHRARGSGGVRRSATRKFVTTGVQGPGSYISFYKPRWEETRAATEDLRQIGRDILDITTSEVTGKRITVPAKGMTASEIEDRLLEFVWDLAVMKFHEWNWIDDEGEALPPLPEVVRGELYTEEIQEILQVTRELFMLGESESEGN